MFNFVTIESNLFQSIKKYSNSGAYNDIKYIHINSFIISKCFPMNLICTYMKQARLSLGYVRLAILRIFKIIVFMCLFL